MLLVIVARPISQDNPLNQTSFSNQYGIHLEDTEAGAVHEFETSWASNYQVFPGVRVVAETTSATNTLWTFWVLNWHPGLLTYLNGVPLSYEKDGMRDLISGCGGPMFYGGLDLPGKLSNVYFHLPMNMTSQRANGCEFTIMYGLSAYDSGTILVQIPITYHVYPDGSFCAKWEAQQPPTENMVACPDVGTSIPIDGCPTVTPEPSLTPSQQARRPIPHRQDRRSICGTPRALTITSSRHGVVRRWASRWSSTIPLPQRRRGT